MGLLTLLKLRNMMDFHKVFNCRYSTSDLDRGVIWDDLWMSFFKGLSHGGIKIRNSEDSLLWMYDKKLGMVTIKKSYEFIVSVYLPLSLDYILS